MWYKQNSDGRMRHFDLCVNYNGKLSESEEPGVTFVTLVWVDKLFGKIWARLGRYEMGRR